jgi:hypothetical protein
MSQRNPDDLKAEYEAAKAAYIAAHQRLTRAKAAWEPVRSRIDERQRQEARAAREAGMAAILQARLDGMTMKGAAAVVGAKSAGIVDTSESYFLDYYTLPEERDGWDWVTDKQARNALLNKALANYRAGNVCGSWPRPSGYRGGVLP